jgi:hypothetical protein
MTSAKHHDAALLLLRVAQTASFYAAADLAELAAWHEHQAEAKALATVERAPACDCQRHLGCLNDCHAAGL